MNNQISWLLFLLLSLISNNFILNLTLSDSKEVSIIPKEGNVKIVGRYYHNLDITWLVQSGSAIEFYASAKSLSVDLKGDNGCLSGKEQRPRYAVYLDDKLFEDALINEKEYTVTLFKGETEKEAKVKIILLSEASFGGIGISKINVISDSEKPIKPVEKKELTIEFIGDSITCAYGIEGDLSSSFSTSTENFMKSYAYVASEILDADCCAVAYSGNGVICGSNGDKSDANLIPPFYTKLSKYWEYNYEWNFDLHPVDIIVINLGTNDCHYVDGKSEDKNKQYHDLYVDFLKLLREKNPDAIIVCTVGMMGADNLMPVIEKAIETFGDDKVYSFLFANQDVQKDGVGAQYHPSVASHKKSGIALAEKISEILKL